jgi:hypothetical protein
MWIFKLKDLNNISNGAQRIHTRLRLDIEKAVVAYR